MNLSEQLRQHLLDAGAVLVGFGDMREVENCPFPTGVAVAVPIPAKLVRALETAPTREYFDTYFALNNRLNQIVLAGENFLSDRGYRAQAQTTDAVELDRERWVSAIPHKTVATRAGLGWIGKNCLLVTRQFGAAIRISSLLTDAPLACNEPTDHSSCGSCHLCVDACPAQALRGTLWEKGMAREEIVDAVRCYEKEREIMRRATGIDRDLCGKCFAVCAWTQKYVRREK